jgi:hydroxymethylpyrimidine/phosphomethylpyrimidine kinase
MMSTGMLGSAATIEMLAQALVDHKVETLVLDPVSKKYCKPGLTSWQVFLKLQTADY